MSALVQNNKLLLINGEPGTGKSQSLAIIAKQLREENESERILVVAPNDIALLQLME